MCISIALMDSMVFIGASQTFAFLTQNRLLKSLFYPNVGKTLSQIKCPCWDWVMASYVVIQRKATFSQFGVIYQALVYTVWSNIVYSNNKAEFLDCRTCCILQLILA